jgi:predicted metal-dependent hydrolase
MPEDFNANDDWPERLPPEFYTALSELNRGEYYRCHETLEALWIPEKRTVRELYQGVLQIAVGCYHLTARANWVGAVNKLEAGARRLERALTNHPPNRYNVDWLPLIQAADRLQTHLRALGRDHLPDYDPSLLPHATYHTPNLESP